VLFMYLSVFDPFSDTRYPFFTKYFNLRLATPVRNTLREYRSQTTN
jgi:hypothetical protein